MSKVSAAVNRAGAQKPLGTAARGLARAWRTAAAHSSITQQQRTAAAQRLTTLFIMMFAQLPLRIEQLFS